MLPFADTNTRPYYRDNAMAITAPQRWLLAEGDTEDFALDMTASLDDTEALANVTDVSERHTNDLIITAKQPNASQYTDPHQIDQRGDPIVVAANKAATFRVSGQQTATGTYTVHVTMTTTAGRELVRAIRFDVA